MKHYHGIHKEEKMLLSDRMIIMMEDIDDCLMYTASHKQKRDGLVLLEKRFFHTTVRPRLKFPRLFFIPEGVFLWTFPHCFTASEP